MSTSRLHLLTTDQYAPLIDQLSRHHQPSCSQFLGWFLQTGHSTVDTLGRSKVYSTHPDPSHLPSHEPVVIVVNNFHRLRIYVSTESGLDSRGPISEAMKEQARAGDWNGEKAPPLYEDPLQSLYKRSVELLEPVLLEVTNQWADSGLLFHGLSILWQPLVNALYQVSDYGPCHMFVKPAQALLECSLDSPYPVSRLSAKDLTEVSFEGSPTGAHSNHTLILCRWSKEIRSSTMPAMWRIASECQPLYEILMVNWWLGDIPTVIVSYEKPILLSSTLQYTTVSLIFVVVIVPIGGLHVLPDYRRRNLASIVASDLCNQQTRFLLDHAPHADTVQYYVQSLVEYSNLGSTALFERLGFTKVGIGMTWTYISLRKEN